MPSSSSSWWLDLKRGMRDQTAWQDVLCCGSSDKVVPKYVQVDNDVDSESSSDDNDDSSTSSVSTTSTTITSLFSALETIWEAATGPDEETDDEEEFFNSKAPIPLQRSHRKRISTGPEQEETDDEDEEEFFRRPTLKQSNRKSIYL